MSARVARRFHTLRLVAAFWLAAATLMLAPATSAQQLVPASSGRAIQIGLRAGYGVPFGKTGRTVSDLIDDDLSKSIKRQMPIGLDIGYRFAARVDVGLLFQYGFGSIGSNDDGSCHQSGVSCSASDLLLGAGADLHLNQTASVDPWIGLGFGYERLDLSISSGGQTFSARASGFEYAGLQLGGDVSISQNVAVGPFVTFAIGKYRSGQYISVSQQRTTQSLFQTISDQPFHEWLLLGVRGVYFVRL